MASIIRALFSGKCIKAHKEKYFCVSFQSDLCQVVGLGLSSRAAPQLASPPLHLSSSQEPDLARLERCRFFYCRGQQHEGCLAIVSTEEMLKGRMAGCCSGCIFTEVPPGRMGGGPPATPGCTGWGPSDPVPRSLVSGRDEVKGLWAPCWRASPGTELWGSSGSISSRSGIQASSGPGSPPAGQQRPVLQIHLLAARTSCLQDLPQG